MKYNTKKKYQIAMRRAYATKTSSKHEIATLLGIDNLEFKAHIDSRRLPSMTIETFGKEWGLDHIVPVDLFDLNYEEEKSLCYNYVNIIPMFNNDNRMKGASIHFSLEYLQYWLSKETNENSKKIMEKLINKCMLEIDQRYSQYLI